ncbi:hypothetical protein Turpa_3478 [Turneriella parva DSM 21527]|uniref:Uncharacterized protein n=1 Tax=Turneriella parva (strain ATCC BAA-1111 / DSM 21527 / NCTC 11395 / H) TaxID=869212 RepID=I4BA08_TURPD|nr:hypothetical protein Turpa_3478 [Turneriella parva DSM 21527]
MQTTSESKKSKIQVARRILLGLLCCAIPLSIHLNRETSESGLLQLLSPLKGHILVLGLLLLLVLWPRLKSGRKR